MVVASYLALTRRGLFAVLAVFPFWAFALLAFWYI
jgi:hypothetical protein